ncbi:MAG: hypothetical protein O2856_07200, partial [Planctomycetota bacterium]|nr:hypothetical protein [Planctomycetota bacterium]
GRNGNPADYALTVFGRSIRESNCDCDRTEEPSLLQTIYVRNDSVVLTMMDDADGWLAQVATNNDLKFNRKSQSDNDGDRNKLAALVRRSKGQIDRLQQQIDVAEKAGKDKQVAALNDQLRKLKKDAKKLGVLDTEQDAAAANAESASGISTQPEPTWKVTEVITDAYLRTVSRFPTDDELQTAKTYIAESSDPIDGVRGVLWALLNTREFIVNH